MSDVVNLHLLSSACDSLVLHDRWQPLMANTASNLHLQASMSSITYPNQQTDLMK